MLAVDVCFLHFYLILIFIASIIFYFITTVFDVVGCSVETTGSPKFVIMWSSASAPASVAEFNVNHVVWLAEHGHDVSALALQVSEESDAESDVSMSLAESDVVDEDEDSNGLAATSMSDEDTAQCNDDDVETLPAKSSLLQLLPQSDGLGPDEVIRLLTGNNQTQVLQTVPVGNKKNVFIAVDNTANVQHKRSNRSNVISRRLWCLEQQRKSKQENTLPR